MRERSENKTKEDRRTKKTRRYGELEHCPNINGSEDKWSRDYEMKRE